MCTENNPWDTRLLLYNGVTNKKDCADSICFRPRLYTASVAVSSNSISQVSKDFFKYGHDVDLI